MTQAMTQTLPQTMTEPTPRIVSPAMAAAACRRRVPAPDEPAATPGSTKRSVALHRLAEVRQQEGISQRTIARRLGVSVAEVKAQEEETADVPLSRLYQWREALEVPLIELLMEPGDSLSLPLLKRARLVRLMKTVLSVLQRAKQVSVRRMAETMVGQLIEIMPELRDVQPWHAVGRRRRLDEYGRTAEQSLPEAMFTEHGCEGTWQE